MAPTPIPTTQLKEGTSIPVLVESIKTAIRLGYHHLDGAEVYGTEQNLGVAIKECGVPREQLFAIEDSLEKLQLSYVDLYLIHQPFFAKSPTELQAAWAAMEKVKGAGKARAIGVPNFLESHLETISQPAKIPPAINQIEYHPYLQNTSYGPLTPATRAKGGPLDLLLPKLAEKYGVGEGEIRLRWSLDRSTVAITTSAKESRLTDKLSWIANQKHYRGFWPDKFAADDRS
ncbi:NADP-dependent oxidoreductase domain-containing protein [Aspergillus falconensis]